MLRIQLEVSVRVVMTKINVEVLVSLKFVGEILLLRDIFLVSLEILVDVLFGSLFNDFEAIDPCILPIGQRDVFWSAKC